jgi:hypothetical protein
MEKNKQVWQDKIGFSEKILEKELQMITEFTATINEVKYNNYPRELVQELTSYKYCWAHINGLYDVLIRDYGDLLEKTTKEELSEIISRYIDFERVVTITDMKQAKECILDMVSKAGFHDLVRRSEEEGDF